MSIMDSDVLLALVSSTSTETDKLSIEEWVKELPTRPHTTALALAEVYVAVLEAPDLFRREIRGRALDRILGGLLLRRVLPFDVETSKRLAALSRTFTPEGKPYPLAILIHAATAQHLKMPLVTGRPGEFAGLDVEVVPLNLD